MNGGGAISYGGTIAAPCTARGREGGDIRKMRRATISDVASTLDQPYRMAAA